MVPMPPMPIKVQRANVKAAPRPPEGLQSERLLATDKTGFRPMRPVNVLFIRIRSAAMALSEPKNPLSFKRLFGGRTRARTWDPLIKSHRG